MTIRVNGHARVVRAPNSIRSYPGEEYRAVYTVGIGEDVSVSAGPHYVPATRRFWWKVVYGAFTGWMVASDDAGPRLVPQAFGTTPLSSDAESPPPDTDPTSMSMPAFPPGDTAWGLHPLPRPTAPESVAAAEQIPSIWSGLNYVELAAPGVQTYHQTINLGPKRWRFFWRGATVDELQHWRDAMKLTLAINGYGVEEKDILQFAGPTAVDWSWATILRGWTSGTTVALAVHYTISEPLTEVAHSLPVGDYTQEIIVTVR